MNRTNRYRCLVAMCVSAATGCATVTPKDPPKPAPSTLGQDCIPPPAAGPADESGKCPIDIGDLSDEPPSKLQGSDADTAHSETDGKQRCFATTEAEQALRRALVATARAYLESPPKTLRGDCSSLVIAILANASVTASGGSRDFWQAAERDGRITSLPTPGDLAFFDATYDANRDGTLDDPLTHVALVVGIDAPDTVVMIHWGSQEVKELRMTLSQPEREQQDGRVLNQPLRSPGAAKQHGQRLAAQLFHGFATPPCPDHGPTRP